jgi:hypothetical protein
MSRYVGTFGVHRVPYLSSSVVAPQADQDTSPLHDLASRTVSHIKAKESTEERVASGTVSFDRDEVSGPLRSALGTDGVVDLDDTYEEEIKEQEGAWTHKVKREQHAKVSPSAFHFLLVPFQTSLRLCRLELKGCLPVKTASECGMSLFPPVSRCTSSDSVPPNELYTYYSLRP